MAIAPLGLPPLSPPGPAPVPEARRSPVRRSLLPPPLRWRLRGLPSPPGCGSCKSPGNASAATAWRPAPPRCCGTTRSSAV
eukprot:4849600-Pleurochrysis_carterae.AAC.1